MPRAARTAMALGGSGSMMLAGAHRALAHGAVPPAPSLTTLISSWSAELLPWVGLIVLMVAYLGAVRVVNRPHPQTPVPVWRVGCWPAGVGAIGGGAGSAR